MLLFISYSSLSLLCVAVLALILDGAFKMQHSHFLSSFQTHSVFVIHFHFNIHVAGNFLIFLSHVGQHQYIYFIYFSFFTFFVLRNTRNGTDTNRNTRKAQWTCRPHLSFQTLWFQTRWGHLSNLLMIWLCSSFTDLFFFPPFLTSHLLPPELQQQPGGRRDRGAGGRLAEAAGGERRPLHQRQLPGGVIRSPRQRLQGRLDLGPRQGGVRGQEQEEQRRGSRGGTEGRAQVFHLLGETHTLRCRGHHGNLLYICLRFHGAFPSRWIDGSKRCCMLIFPTSGNYPCS